MNFQELVKTAKLSVAETTALLDVAAVVEQYLANRTFSSAPLSSAVITHLLDSGKIGGHELDGTTLSKFSETLAGAVEKCEQALPRLSPLGVNESDPFQNETSGE